ncbi:hypothetical protein GXW82_35695 [Streptacidiphilus sp. 4-A2]|nr:hypothetical protein [Streptacidiphilus sp. 4-A2]
MSDDGRAERMVDRLMAIQWHDLEGPSAHAWSRAALMREYLRRAALWADAYTIDDEWPFLDLAAYVDPTVRADPQLLARLESFMEAGIGPNAEESCVAATHWAALLDARKGSLPDLADPFEPLVTLFERGGGFATENRSADFIYSMIRFRNRQHHLSAEPIIALERAVLDEIDAQGSERLFPGRADRT